MFFVYMHIWYIHMVMLIYNIESMLGFHSSHLYMFFAPRQIIQHSNKSASRERIQEFWLWGRGGGLSSFQHREILWGSRRSQLIIPFPPAKVNILRWNPHVRNPDNNGSYKMYMCQIIPGKIADSWTALR